ncbi:MAG: choice-of-anchor E domain-containing protein, partial [Pseudomonadota bacterium]
MTTIHLPTALGGLAAIALCAAPAPAAALESYHFVKTIGTLANLGDGAESLDVETTFVDQQRAENEGDRNFSEDFVFPAFDTSLGTLEAARVVLNASISPDGTINNDDGSQGHRIEDLVATSELELRLVLSGPNKLLRTSGEESVKGTDIGRVDGTDPFDIPIPSGSLDRSLDTGYSLGRSERESVLTEGPTFRVTAALSLVFDTVALDDTSSDTFSSMLFPNGSGTLTLTYEYEPFAVPEPEPGADVPLPGAGLPALGGLAALGAAARR